MDLSPASREPVGLPAPFRLVAGSLLIAFILNLLPWSGWALLARPEFLLLMLVYWGTHESRAIGQGWGFVFGLLMDVANSVLLGQTALVYVVALFCVQLLRVRILHLRIFEQALHVGAILFVAQTVGLLIGLALGRDWPGFSVLFSPLLGGLMWPLVSFFAGLPRLRRRTNRISVR